MNKSEKCSSTLFSQLLMSHDKQLNVYEKIHNFQMKHASRMDEEGLINTHHSLYIVKYICIA